MKKDTIIYGYARVSTMKQRIQRQIDNIKAAHPDAIIIDEAYTGTRIDRPKFSKLMEQVRKDRAAGRDVTIVFDEVSRMSRNATEGFALYKQLFDLGVNLEFIKEPCINSSVFAAAIEQARKNSVSIATGDDAMDKLTSAIMDALKELQMDLARRQIEIAFQTAQAEVDFIHQRTSEGVRRAMAAGHYPGPHADTERKPSKKELDAKKLMRKNCKDFGGANSDAEVMAMTHLARNTYYKYKRQLKQEMEG